jgi:hypothetical protein
MRIVVLVEGATEMAFKEKLSEFLRDRLAGKLPRIVFQGGGGRIPTGDRLRKHVQNLFVGNNAANVVIALTDVYTGTREFNDAADAKAKMKAWVGSEPRFYPHVAQYDFEAWLLPFWPTIQKLAKHNKHAPPGPPESVNHDRPPARRIQEIFQLGGCRDSYNKPRDAKRILKENDLLVSANKCPELKSFLNTILSVCGGELIP